MFKLGKMTRREFMVRASALGLTAAAFPIAMNRNAHASKPKLQGNLRIGCDDAHITDALDPVAILTALPALISLQIRNPLVEIDHNAQPIPELAESWEAEPGATKWVFKLRKGVEFHNGKTFDAKDVIYSFNRHRGKGSKSPAKVIVDPIVEMKADDKYTVVFTLKEGNADFPYLLCDYHLQIVPDGTTDFEKGIGTGGYILEHFEPGVRGVTRHNPNYWKKGRAHFETIETIGINDVHARTTALRTGQVDLIKSCDRKTVHMLESQPGIQVIETFGTKHYVMCMRCDIPPFDNNEARLAMKYAVDREHLLKAILRGHGRIGNDNPISPANRYFASELPQRRYDPEKARFHLKKAGMTDNTFKLHASNVGFPGGVDASILFKEHAAKAGINIDVVRAPDDGYWSKVWQKKEFCLSYSWGRPVENWMLSTVYAADAPWNDSFWRNEKFNNLLKEARTVLDENKRREMYVEMQRIIRDDGGAIIPLFPSDIMAASDGLKYENLSSTFEMDNMRFHERWWFGS